MDTQQISHQYQSSIETRNTFRRNPQSYTCWFSIRVLFIEPLNFWLDTFFIENLIIRKSGCMEVLRKGHYTK